MLRIEILRSHQALEKLREPWNDLYGAGRYSIFQSFDWNLLAAKVFDGCAPTVVHAQSDSGAAIIPACVRHRQIEFLGDELFDYRDVLAAGDPEVLRAAWRQIAGVHLPLSLTALRGHEPRQSWEELGFSTTPFCYAPGIRRADCSAEEFVTVHAKAARAVRRLAGAGFSVRQYTGSDTALLRRIYESKARQPISGNLFAEDPRRCDFMVTIAGMDARCEIFVLESASTLAGALVTLRDGQVRRFYTIYFEPACAHYSPGIALLFEVARRSLDEGLDCDYMTGEQPHKTRFGKDLVPLFRIHAAPEVIARVARTAAPAVVQTAELPQAA